MAFILSEGVITQLDAETEDIEGYIKLDDSSIIDFQIVDLKSINQEVLIISGG